jgi:hypothetical protein
MSRGLALVAVFILLSAPAAGAQNPRPAPKHDDPKPSDRFPDDSRDEHSNLPDEMRVKMAIARAEQEHKKILEDVDKLRDLSGQIALAYGDRGKLSSEDVKKLGAIEKLARRVLNFAGGEQVDDKDGAPQPATLAEAIDKLNSSAEDIKKDMAAETRFVVSAAVIEKSNEVIRLARFIRRPPRSR